jgi:putative endonuclease
MLAAPMSPWFVYLIRTSDDVLYTGISTDVERRVTTHARGRGAKFLRGRGPLEVAYRCRIGERGLAQRVEIRLKRLARPEKEAIVRSTPTRLRLIRMLGANVES